MKVDKYQKQVDASYYNLGYDDVHRFVSYFNQQKILQEIIKTLGKEDVRILEIGNGTGFLRWQITSTHPKIVYKTFDIASDLKPDYVGDICNIKDIVSEKFDIVVCFEVLEHIRFADVLPVLKQIAALTRDYFVISVPHIKLHFVAWFKLSLIKPLKLYLRLPFPIKHKFDGEHYWELGKKGYGLKTFRKKLNRYFNINREFEDAMDNYHRFYIMKTKK